jgi:DNA-binding CsgD family transcriptional regulator
MPDDLRRVCDDLRRRWARDVFGFRSVEDNLVEHVQHPLHPALKAIVSIPPRPPGIAALPSILVRYAGMAIRADPAFQPTRAQLAVLAQLTPGERNVTLLVMRGMSNREIADALHREVSTVKDHLSHIYDKLGIRRRTQLAAFFTE